MTSAIIITGEIRTLDKCLPNLWWFCFRYFPDAHVFVSTVKDGNSHKAALLRKYFQNVTIEEVDAQPDFPDLKPWTPGQFYSHEPYAISVTPAAVLRQLWQLEKGWQLYLQSGIEAEVVIRCRPDLWFHDFDSGTEWLNPFPTDAFVPNWGAFGGIPDRFAILGRTAAESYFTTFSHHSRLMNIGCPLHPESLVKAALDSGGCKIIPSKFIFSTLRMDGTMRPPEIVASDFLK